MTLPAVTHRIDFMRLRQLAQVEFNAGGEGAMMASDPLSVDKRSPSRRRPGVGHE